MFYLKIGTSHKFFIIDKFGNRPDAIIMLNLKLNNEQY